jgi:hypothetical protein
MSEPPAATGYAYALPSGWVHLDVEPARRAASVRRAVGERIRREPRLARHIAQLDRLLTHECAVAAAHGAERVSLLAEPTADGVLTATATFAVASQPDAKGPDAKGPDANGPDANGPDDKRPDAKRPDDRAPDTVEVLAQVVPAHEEARRHDPDASLRIVSTSQQQAVVRCWREAAPIGAAAPLRLQVHQLLAPWPGRPAVGLLTLSSPCEPVWPMLDELFEACVATFHWTWSGPAGEAARSG